MIALVTGAAQGIGYATAALLVKEGYQLCLFDMLDPGDAAEKLGGGGSVISVQGDVTKADDVDRAVAQTVDKFGRIDCVVTAAGVVQVKPALDVDPTEFASVMAVNVAGSFLPAQRAARAMAKSGGGSIIFIGSVYGSGGAPQRTAYCASKGAVHNMTRSLAVEWGPLNIRVNAVAPTGTRTPMVQDLIDRGVYNLKGVKARTPLGRLAEPDEVAAAVAFLASPAAKMINGVILPVDGGWTANGFTVRQD